MALKCSILLICLLASALCWGQTTSHGKSKDGNWPVDASLVASAVALVCPAESIVKSPDGGLLGCGVCPTGSDFQEERGVSWELRRTFTGHFTSATSEDIVIGVAGCESHSNNFGGTFLFKVESGRPRFLTYNPAVVISRCTKLHFPDAREFLVCQRFWGGQGWTLTFLESIVFDANGKSGVTPLFMTEDSVNTCSMDEEGHRNFKVQSSAIKSVEFTDLNVDGLADLSLQVTLGRKLLSASEAEKCEESSRASNFEHSSISFPTKKYKITFLFDGKTFQPTTASKRIISLFPKPTFPN